MRAERATVTGVDLDWPERVAVGRVALAQPSIVVERDAEGRLALNSLLTERAGTCRGCPVRGQYP